MKKILLSMLAVVMTMTVSAQIAAGDYVIQNVETGYFLGGGNDWGTHASLLGKPQVFTLSGSDGVYTLDSHQSNGGDNHFLNTSLYMDGGASEWTFAETSTAGVYTIKNGDNYLAGNGVNAIIQTVTDATAAAAQWKVISKQSIIDSMNGATITSPIDVTALIAFPELKRNCEGWTKTGFSTADSPNNFSFGSGGNAANCAESYHSSNGFKVSQTISDLKAGVYRLDAKGFYRKDGTGTALPYMFLGEQTSTLPARTGSENSMAGAYASFLSGSYAVDPLFAEVADGGSITIGFAGEATDMWNIFGEMGLTYYGSVSENDKTYMIVNPGFETGDISGWTNNSAANMWTMMTRSNATDPKVGKYWVEKYTVSGKIDLKQTIKGLPKGLYRVGVKALDQAGTTKLIANNGDIQQETTISGGSASDFTVDIYVDDNGSLTLGLYCESHPAYTWVGYDNFTLTYVPDEYPTLSAVEGKMNSTVSANQTTALNAYAGEKSYANYVAAVKAIDAAKESIATYVKIADIKTKAEALDESASEKIAIVTDGYTNCTYETLAQAEADYRTAVKAQTNDGADFTGAIVNPNFDGNIDGWTDGYVGMAGNHNYQGATYTNGEVSVSGFMEAWTWNSALADGKLSQIVKDLPAGNYTLSANLISVAQGSRITDGTAQVGVYVFATCAAGTFKSEDCSTEDGKPQEFSFTFDTSAGDCELGLMTHSTNCNWIAFDNVKLIRNGASTINVFQEGLKAAVAEAAENYDDADCDQDLKTAYNKAYSEAKTASTTDDQSNEYYQGYNKALTDAYEAVQASIAAYAPSKPLRDAIKAGTNVWTATDDFAGWTLDHEDGNFHKNTWSTEADGTGMVKPFGEYWTGGSALANGVISYNTLKGLPAGNYAVSLLVRVYDSTNAAYDGVKFNDIDITADGVLTKVHYGNNLNGVYGVVTDVIEVAEGGDLNFGFNVKDANASWLVWKGLTIKYLGDKTSDAAATVSVKTAGKCGTFCAPYVVARPEGAQVYTVGAYQEGSETLLALTEVEGAIPANTPVIVCGESAAIKAETTGVAYSTINNNLKKGWMTGVLAETTVPVGSYVLQTKNNVQKFYKVDGELKLAANKAYLTVPEATGVKALGLGLEGDETAVETIEALTSGSAKIYDLNGRQLDRLQKGINIVNGKKILVK